MLWLLVSSTLCIWRAPSCFDGRCQYCTLCAGADPGSHVDNLEEGAARRRSEPQKPCCPKQGNGRLEAGAGGLPQSVFRYQSASSVKERAEAKLRMADKGGLRRPDGHAATRSLHTRI